MIGDLAPARLVTLRAEPLTVPLREPFVIATARMDTTRAALVQVTLETADGISAAGLGEAAALWPVTREDQPEILALVSEASSRLAGLRIGPDGAWRAALDETFASSPVARAGVETAIVDALARLAGAPLGALLTSEPLATELVTDVTLGIAEPSRMAENAIAWRARGFDCFKVKVGRSWDDDRAALLAVHDAVPDARFRLDANEGFDAGQAIALLDAIRDAGLEIECFEQPCRRDDHAGLAAVRAHGGAPVIADESLRSMDDLDDLLRARAIDGVNLKLVKLGGPLAAFEVGARAKREGLRVMAGAMVETRLGLTAMAHVVAALGGVDFVDLDTAFLLASDPFEGGIEGDGPHLHVRNGAGLAVRVR